MRLKILDPLRGLAALAVVLYHYSAYLLPSILPNKLSGVFAYGTYGVQVFFVISGLVIPYAMSRSGYTLRTFPVFMVKRIVRIGPPAWITCLMVIGFWHLQLATAPGHVDLPWPGYGLRAIVANLTFTAGHLHTHFYNFVQWTLDVEFQYYVFIGLLLPFIVDPSHWLRTCLICIAVTALGYTGISSFPASGGSFVLGIALFLLHAGSIDKKVFWTLIAITCAMMATQREPIWMYCSLGTVLVIHSGLRLEYRITDWLGKVSYSLYIVHVPVGLVAENLMFRYTGLHTSEAGKLLLLFGYTATAIVCAGVFHKWVEQPFIVWAKTAGDHVERWTARIIGSGPNRPVSAQEAVRPRAAGNA